jgi:hypothetical protein
MIDQIEIRQRLDGCQHIYLARFDEGDSQFDATIEVIEARADQTETWKPSSSDAPASEFDSVRDIVLNNSVAISPRPGCAHFTITFAGFVLFSVRDESGAKPAENEDFTRKLRTYDESRLLDHVKATYWAPEDLLGPIKHYSVVCLDRIVDVISTTEPVISMRITDASEYLPTSNSQGNPREPA